MKRCPQCEFIYEDDQSLCDMDGVLLVMDSRTLPNLHALATVSAPMPGKAARRNRMVPAFATLILMLVVGSVYYVFTMRDAVSADIPPVSVSAMAAEPVPVLQPAPLQISEPETEARETSPTAAKPTSAPAKKATAVKPTADKPAAKKDDSKVESILKKTGKILKKPFKF